MKIKTILLYSLHTVLPLGLLLLSGCNLDRDSEDMIPLKETFKTFEDATRWNNGLNSTLRGRLTGAYAMPQEVQADMLHAYTDGKGAGNDFYKWEQIRPENKLIGSIYHSYYASITDVNLMLKYFPSIPLKNGEAPRMNIYLGEAHFARAFYYFNLAMRWGERYNAESADKDLCVPLNVDFTPTVRQNRATNKEVYDTILQDLSNAESLLSGVSGTLASQRITVDVVRALQARVYLYMGEMKEALAIAERLISSGIYPLLASTGPDGRPNQDAFVEMWLHDSGSEQIYMPYVAKPDEMPGGSDLYGANQSLSERKNVQINTPSHFTAQWVLDAFAEEDLRGRAYFEYGNTLDLSDRVVEDVVVVSKFKGNPLYKNASSSFFGGYLPNAQYAPKPFRIAEQYLIASEAAFEMGQEPKAQQYLNALRLSRGLKAVTASGEELRAAIRNERMLELFGEGFRLWDLRRWGESVRRHDPQKPGIVVKSSDDGEVYPNSDPRFVWPFPAEEVKEIPGFRQNDWEVTD